MTLKELYDEGTNILEEAGIESPEVDAFYLICECTHVDRASYLLYKSREVTESAQDHFFELIEKRKSHIPYQYIIGEADFMGYKMKVTPDVLIPRLDTEVLCEETLKLCKKNSRVLDMCTGSGCLAIAISLEADNAAVSACDISQEALDIAMYNAKANGADICFVKGDLFENIEGKFDIIVSNPPYVTEAEYTDLSAEVKDHEPKLALTAGDDGLDIYKRLIPDAGKFLEKSGYLIMEMGCAQADELTKLLEKEGYREIKVIKDLAGLDRVIVGKVI